MSTPKKYLTNKALFVEVTISQARGIATRKLTKMIMTLVSNVIRKYSYRDPQDKKDCESHAIMVLYENYHLFDKRKSSNVFAYFTEIVKRALAQQFNVLMGNPNRVGYTGKPIPFSVLFVDSNGKDNVNNIL